MSPMKEKLGKDADAGDYIDDFMKSDAPQFKGKSKEKKRDMAIAAYLDAKDKNEEVLDEKIAGLVKKSKQTGVPYGILKKSYDRGMLHGKVDIAQAQHHNSGCCKSELNVNWW